MWTELTKQLMTSAFSTVGGQRNKNDDLLNPQFGQILLPTCQIRLSEQPPTFEIDQVKDKRSNWH